jgi:integrase
VGRNVRFPLYTEAFIDRHGRPRHYLRRAGYKRVPLPGLPWSPEFMAAYEAAMAGETAPAPREIGASRTAAGSVDHVIASYYASSAFASLAPLTQRHRRFILEKFRVEHGAKRFAMLQREHVVRIIGKLRPFAQKEWVKTIRHMNKFALDTGMITTDPTAGVKPARAPKSTGFKTWEEQDIAAFEAHFPVGSVPRLAFAIMLFTGLRISDSVRLGAQHIRNGVVSIRPQKTSRTTAVEVHIPLHPQLVEIIRKTPSRQLTFLVGKRGKPLSAAVLGNMVRDWCDEIGLSQLSAHGLRKAAGRRLAEAGATEKEIAAILGDTDPRAVAIYTRGADGKKLAAAGIEKVVAAFGGAKHERQLPNSVTRFGKTRK